MIVFKYSRDISEYRKKAHPELSIGFVPTMGALHAGHISLIQTSKQSCDKTISSIFVNPTQFNNPDDLQKYPVTIEKDIYLLEENGCDVLFLPSVNEIYPDRSAHLEKFDLGYLETILEGKFRPGHFQGVCQAVKRLLEIVQPTHLFIGQKDYQQCMVIKRLLQQIGSDIKLVICPTKREEGGLAMSSRNMRLNAEQKKRAQEIFNTISTLKEVIRPGNIAGIKKSAMEKLEEKGCKPDYVEIANADTLESVEIWDGSFDLVILAAAYVDDIRLIDNVLLNRL